MFFRSLSGRFLMLTIIFVMLAEILIFVPSVARFREDYLLARLERSQIASLALLASPGFIEEDLARELLENAGVFNVVLRRDAVRELVLSSPLPQPVSATFDLRDPGAVVLMRDAMAVLFDPENRVIRVIGDPVREAGLLIEVTLETGPLRIEMLEYGQRILWLSLAISVSTALLLFVAVQLLMVAPIRPPRHRPYRPHPRIARGRGRPARDADPTDRQPAPEGAAGAIGRGGSADQP